MMRAASRTGPTQEDVVFLRIFETFRQASAFLSNLPFWNRSSACGAPPHIHRQAKLVQYAQKAVSLEIFRDQRQRR